MKDVRFQEIQELVRRFDALPDAAFLAALAEHGVDANDLLRYTREDEKRKRTARNARRVGR